MEGGVGIRAGGQAPPCQRDPVQLMEPSHTPGQTKHCHTGRQVCPFLHTSQPPSKVNAVTVPYHTVPHGGRLGMWRLHQDFLPLSYLESGSVGTRTFTRPCWGLP